MTILKNVFMKKENAKKFKRNVVILSKEKMFMIFVLICPMIIKNVIILIMNAKSILMNVLILKTKQNVNLILIRITINVNLMTKINV